MENFSWEKENNTGSGPERRNGMIEVTKLNGKTIMLNAEMIISVEETPDTIILLNTGTKILVKESRQQVRERVIAYKKEIFQGILKTND